MLATSPHPHPISMLKTRVRRIDVGRGDNILASSALAYGLRLPLNSGDRVGRLESAWLTG